MSILTAFAAAVHRPAFEVKVRWDGVTDTDESTHVLGANGVESMDDLAMPHPRDATVVLDNADGRYTPGNTASPLYAWTRSIGQRVTLRGGYDVDTTGGWEQVGTYTIRDLILDVDERTATITLRDAAEDLAGRKTNLTPTANLSLTTAATSLLSAAGVASADSGVDTLAGTAAYAYARDADLLTELWQLAIAEGGRVYVDQGGVLRIQSRANRRAALRSPVATLTASAVAYRSAPRSRSTRPNRVSLAFEDRTTASIAEPVFSLKTPIKVDGGMTVDNWELKPAYVQQYNPDGSKNGSPSPWPGSPKFVGGIYVGNYPGSDIDAYTISSFFAAGVAYLALSLADLTRWKSNIPADMSSPTITIVANTAADGSGSAVTVTQGAMPSSSGTTLFYAWDGARMVMSFFNSRFVPVWVRQLDISAKPSRAEAAYRILVTDGAALADNAGVAVEREVASAYLGDQPSATARARDILATLSAGAESVDLPDIDGAPFLRPGDAFTLIDDMVTPARTYALQVLENRWSFSPRDGYRASLATMPALAAAAFHAAAVVVPVGTWTPTRTDYTGPFRWGADANAGAWGRSSWG